MVNNEETFVRRTVKNSISGTVSGIAGVLIGHPFDTVKVRLQTQPLHNPVYTGVGDCFVKTLKWEGIGGLYKGLGSPITGQMIFRATLFTTYYQVGASLAGEGRKGQRLSTHEYFICGAVTGLAVSIVECPIDLGLEPQYRHVFHAGYDIAVQHKVRGVYQGLSATILRNIPAFGFAFGFYEWSRDMVVPPGGTVADLTFYQHLYTGGLAGLTYWLCTYPLDVIKSSLQSDDSDIRNRKYRGIFHCARTLYIEGGSRTFFRGFTPCLMRSVPVSAVMLLVVERCRNFINRLV